MSGARIVIVAAGLGGTIAAFEIRAATNGKAEVTVINDQDDSWFVPSNPWVAVKWREPDAIRVHLPTIMAKRGIGFTSAGAKRVHPGENRVELNDGSSVAYDYLVLATGPDLAFDEIAGLGPDGFTQSVCRTDHAAAAAAEAFDRFCENPGPIVVGAAQAEDGAVEATHDLPFGFSMILPAFRGVPAVFGIEGLTNPRGFILADKHQRNPAFPNVYSRAWVWRSRRSGRRRCRSASPRPDSCPRPPHAAWSKPRACARRPRPRPCTALGWRRRWGPNQPWQCLMLNVKPSPPIPR